MCHCFLTPSQTAGLLDAMFKCPNVTASPPTLNHGVVVGEQLGIHRQQHHPHRHAHDADHTACARFRPLVKHLPQQWSSVKQYTTARRLDYAFVSRHTAARAPITMVQQPHAAARVPTTATKRCVLMSCHAGHLPDDLAIGNERCNEHCNDSGSTCQRLQKAAPKGKYATSSGVHRVT